jgi:hypothetical protein
MVVCAAHGEVEIVGLSAAPIPWPIGRTPPRGRPRFLIVYADLVEAVRRESSAAIQHWWGVSYHTVWAWRKALNVGPMTEGSTQLLREATAESLPRAREAARPLLTSPEHAGKIRAGLRASTTLRRPPAPGARTRKGIPQSEEARRKMREAHARGTGRKQGKRWTPGEDALVKALPLAEAAQQTGRTGKAVQERRKRLAGKRAEEE